MDQRQPAADPEAIKKAEEVGFARGVASIRKRFSSWISSYTKAQRAAVEAAISKEVAVLEQRIAENEPPISPVARALPASTGRPAEVKIARPARALAAPRENGHDARGLAAGERKVLVAIAQNPGGVRRETITVVTGYKRSSRDTYIQRLSQKGLVAPAGDRVVATEAGVTELGDDFEPLPTGPALRDQVLRDLPEGEAKVLQVLIDHYPDLVSRDEIDVVTGYRRSSRDTYLQRLRLRELVEVAKGGVVRARDNLF